MRMPMLGELELKSWFRLKTTNQVCDICGETATWQVQVGEVSARGCSDAPYLVCDFCNGDPVFVRFREDFEADWESEGDRRFHADYEAGRIQLSAPANHLRTPPREAAAQNLTAGI